MKYKLTIQEQSFEVEIGAVTGDVAEVMVDRKPYTVRIETEKASAPDRQAAAMSVPPMSAEPGTPPAAPQTVAAPVPPPKGPVAPAGGEQVVAPIPGIILSIAVQVGDRVAAGQLVAVMEAMKMENNLICHTAGTVREIRSGKGAEVATGDVIMVVG